MALTSAQRKANERAGYRKLGRVPVQVWVHPDDRARVQKYAAAVNKQREVK